jgi:hypothetical protein
MQYLILGLGLCIIGYVIVHLRYRTPNSVNSSIDMFDQKRAALQKMRKTKKD